ncbi:hypothetical protein B0H13DRAFT_2581396, partial [Mycena leptocephala]
SVRLGAFAFLLPLLSYPSCIFLPQRDLQIPLSSSRGGASATLPVFIRKDTTQKWDSFDLFSDVGVVWGHLDARVRCREGGNADARRVSRMLPDYSLSAPSSSSSDTERKKGRGIGLTRGLRLCGTLVISFDPCVRRFLINPKLHTYIVTLTVT